MIVYVTIRQHRYQKGKKSLARDGAIYKTDFFGIEIDLDAIPNIASSAMTLSGFSVEELRQFISFLVKQNVSYTSVKEHLT
jgi:formiminoglutamase